LGHHEELYLAPTKNAKYLAAREVLVVDVLERFYRLLSLITPPLKYQNIFSRQTPIKQYFYAAKIQIIGWWSNNRHHINLIKK
jgi:hypothetical protein